jgi:hypothetical protein
MAHFAELNNDNTVSRVIVVNNNELLDENGAEQETLGIAFCQSVFGLETRWVQTSYNGSFRKVFAGIGAFYDEANDRFINPKPWASWILNEETGNWESPVPMPPYQEYTAYVWNEDIKDWDVIIDPKKPTV